MRSTALWRRNEHPRQRRGGRRRSSGEGHAGHARHQADPHRRSAAGRDLRPRGRRGHHRESCAPDPSGYRQPFSWVAVPSDCLGENRSRVKVRPEFAKALVLARDIKQAASDQSVILTAHEMKRWPATPPNSWPSPRPWRQTASSSSWLTGPLTGIHDPAGMGAILFAVLVVAAQLDHNYIWAKTLERSAGRPPRHDHVVCFPCEESSCVII